MTEISRARSEIEARACAPVGDIPPREDGTVTTSNTRRVPAERSTLRSVAVPSEHGGWGLTLEPGLLGLLVAPGAAGVCLAVAAFVAFLARTPLKVVLVDRRRGRWLGRTQIAVVVAVGELAVLSGLIALAFALANGRFWMPALVSGPLVLVQLGFEARSRGRRLIPELAGAVGVCSVAAMIALADGESGRLAAGIWMVLAARAVTSIPHVREMIARLHNRPVRATITLVADGAAITVAAAATLTDRGLVAGALAVAVVVAVQRLTARGPVPRPAVLGMRQMAMGLAVVVATAIGVLASTH